MSYLIRNGKLTPRANAQACFKSTLSATSEEVGKMTVSGTFIHYKTPDTFGAEYKLHDDAEWTQVTDSLSTVGTVALTITGLTQGETYDVRMFWTLAGVQYAMDDAVECTIMAPEPEPEPEAPVGDGTGDGDGTGTGEAGNE